MTLLVAVTVFSLLLAAAMSLIAWRVAAEERRRSAARVAALAAEIHAPAAQRRRVAPFGSARPSSTWTDDLALRPSPARSSPEPFAPRPGDGRQWGVALVLLCAGAVAAGAFGFTVLSRMPSLRGASRAPIGAAAPAATAAAAAQPAPLQLIALSHDRDDDRLTVRGRVRNPADGGSFDRLTVVVLMFDGDGRQVTSGRAAVEPPLVRPGAESAFVVVVPGAEAVARYRVSFRTADGVVPHVDNREARVSS